jgi:hypothetical protein
MKKTMLISLVVLGISAIKVNAQTAAGRPLPEKKGDEWQMPKDILLRSRDFSQKVKKSLSLDSATTKKVFDLYLGNTKTVDEIRIGSGSAEDKNDALAANQREFDQKIKELVNAKQFELYMQQRKSGKLDL